MSFKFCSLSSGSSGNSEYIETEHSKILIDAGFSGKTIENLLKYINVDPSKLDAIFVTHEHADHIKGIGVLSRRYDLPIIANTETWYAMDNKIGKINDKNIYVFENNRHINFKDLDILPIKTSHDSANSCGYVISKDDKKLSIVTDTGIIEDSVYEEIKDSNLFFIEANHDVDMLKYGSYPPALKQRILSDHGHLSNDSCAYLLGDILRGNHEVVQLAHLSKENNTPRKALSTVEDYLKSLGLDVGEAATVEVAERYSPSNVVDLEKMEIYAKNCTRSWKSNYKKI